MKQGAAAAVEIRVLGPLRVAREGVELLLPRSRKVRTLLALLAVEPSPLSRSRLCDLLWDAANDPRAELRWCLSKLRGVLDDGERRRVSATAQSAIFLEKSDCFVDANELDGLAADDLAREPTERLVELSSLVRGDFLEGMQVEGPELTAWLLGHRQRYRATHVAILSELTGRAGPASQELFRLLETWLQRAPFDTRAHVALIEALVKGGRARDAEMHVSSTVRAFEQEGLDWAAVRSAWHAARRVEPTPRHAAPSAAVDVRAPRRGSVFVMPFVEARPGASQLAHGLTDDIITRLAKLRVLFVIARGTSYALSERGIDAREAGQILNVEYVVSGRVRRHGRRIDTQVELAETQGGGIVWTDEFEGADDDTFSVLDSIIDRIVAAISEEIERAECKRAILKPPSSLDAWEAYHRGLWHMYKFTGPDNELGCRFFREALTLDPSFARAHAGLSFTHFQNVFLGLTSDRDRQLALALETASQSLASDQRDPAAHWAMGRALWLGGDQSASIAELERCVELSPNFALGHYTLGFVHAQTGDPKAAIEAIDYSRELSPFDPLQFGMLGSRALAHMRLGEREAAAEWAVKAASRPNAHAHILAIAAVNLALVSRPQQAREVVARLRSKRPSYLVEDFLRAFRFAEDVQLVVREAAQSIDFDR
jgi:TolB-like protein